MVLIKSGVNLTAKRLLAHINVAPEVQAPNERVVMKIIYLQGQAAVSPPPRAPTVSLSILSHARALSVWYALHG